jgi:hypothetical protein
MTAQKTFDNVIDRSRSIVELYTEVLQHEKQTVRDPSDLLRSSIVFAVAAMDAYFTDKFCQLFVSHLKKKGPNDLLIGQLEKAGFSTKMALELLKKDRPMGALRSLMEKYLAKYTTQKMDAIDELFKSYAIAKLSNHAQSYSKRKNLLKTVANAVERRHAIVHEGDMNSHGSPCKLKSTTVSHYISAIEKYVHSAESILNNSARPKKKSKKSLNASKKSASKQLKRNTRAVKAPTAP